MAYIQLSYSVLDGFAGRDLIVVGDPSSEWGKQAAAQIGGKYLGGDLQAAHDAATSGKGTTIIVGPGTYTLTSALAITKNNIYFKAAHVNPVAPTVIITSSLADTVQVDSNYVTFDGFEFKAGADACTQLIDVADTAASVGLEIKNCVFNPNGKATVKAINAADASFAMTQAYIHDNSFLLGFDTTCIAVGVLGFANSLVTKNLFQITGAKNAITLADTTAFATGYGYRIIENDYIGGDATGDEVAIAISGTEDTTGCGIIARNYGSYVAAAMITADKLSKSEVNNYAGDAATGGTLVDPGT